MVLALPLSSMEKFLKHTITQALWLFAIFLLASSSVLHARVISGQTREDYDTRSTTMTTMTAASNIIGSGGQLYGGKCIKATYWYLCLNNMVYYGTLDECLVNYMG
ncbi:hypothetical protein BDA96_07G043000 [Sorghum bicolor]|uniref:Uncharacterized protein n=2 Tax=Sorghum bicolor TaxID=4558 RepID=A0A921U9E4_SORBI|nr:hypothetical protein BDA96_07G043000 [Sorghum bicolor]KXG24427.1 hypothetical protein SORBI_3007G040700 [Sorghum bicolor]